MERQPYGTYGVPETRRIPYRIAKKLGRSYKVNENSIRSYKETIRQEKKESSRVESWRQCVARKQKHPLKQTLKKARPKKIQTF